MSAAAGPSATKKPLDPQRAWREARELISEHAARTGSLVGRNVLASWDRGARERFVKVMPRDFKRALAAAAEAAAQGETVEA